MLDHFLPILIPKVPNPKLKYLKPFEIFQECVTHLVLREIGDFDLRIRTSRAGEGRGKG
jgi:hypothetical protein